MEDFPIPKLGFLARERNPELEVTEQTWKLVVESIIGHFEKSKAERGEIPSTEMQGLWQSLAPTMPYRDPRNGAIVLYEEYSMGASKWYRSDKIWNDLPWWTHGISFRVTLCDSTAVRASAEVVPTEVLCIICDYAYQSARHDSTNRSSQIDRDAILHIALTCRTWARARHRFLFAECYDKGKAVDEADVPRYIKFVARYAIAWKLQYDASSPTWLRRYMALYTSSQRQIRRNKNRRIDAEISLDIISEEQNGRDEEESTAHSLHRYCSIFNHCPKPLPPQCIPSLTSVKLSMRFFQSFADLSHLVWELPSLQQLSCKYLIFNNLHAIAPPTLRMQPSSQIRIVTTYCDATPHFVLLMTSLFKIKTKKGTGILSHTDALLLIELLRSCAGSDWEENSGRRRMIFERHNNSCEAYIDLPRSFLRFNLEQISDDMPHNLCISLLNFSVGYGSRVDGFNWHEIGKCVMSLPSIQEPFSIYFPFLDQAELYTSAAYIVSQLPDMWVMGRLEFFSGKDRLDEDGIREILHKLEEGVS